MRFFRHLPIKQKLTAITMLAAGVALLLACVAFATYEQMNFRSRVVRDLSIIADMTGANTAAGLTFNDASSVEQTLNSLRAHPHIIRACVYDKGGQLFAIYQRADVKDPFLAPFPQADDHRFGERHLDLFRRISFAGETIGTIYVQSDLREVRERIWRYALIVAALLLAGSLVAFLLASRMQRIISEPIANLATTAATVATHKNYAIRAAKQCEDEIGSLIDGFNEMLAQIQERDTALQRARNELEKRVEERTVELSKANSELRDAAARFHAVWESAHDAMRLLDDNGVIVAVNAAFCRLFGMKREELEGAPFTVTYADGRDPAELQERFRERFRKNHIVPQEERRMVLRDGRTVDLEISSTLIKLPGSAALLLGLFRDITERKRMEQAVAYERDLLRTLLDNSPDHIYFKDGESRFLKCSRTLCQRLGLDNPDDIIGKNDFDLFNEEHARPAFDDEQRIIRTGDPVIGKVEYEAWKNGEESWVLTTKMPFRDKSGAIVGTFGISKDITALKKAQAELDATHRQLLETSRQAGMAEVATGVLHNVGNVLNSVNVSTTLVAEQVKMSKVANLAKAVALMDEHAADLSGFMTNDPRGKQMPGYLAQLARHLAAEQATLLKETDELRKNIEHIKDIVAMQQSYAKVSGVTETLTISDLVEDALRMNASALTRHKVQVIREYAEVPPIIIDKHKVLQVLVNLIRNAKYACDESGRMDKQMTVRVANGEGRIKIAISDNGVGIPAENLLRIFNHGFTTRKDGHGFGLHSGALAARELGGSLSVRSGGLGEGATFTLELPVNLAKENCTRNATALLAANEQ